MARLLAVLVVCISLGACAATGPKYNEVAPTFQNVQANKVRMILLREQQLLYMALDARVEINGLNFVSLSNGAFTISDREPGQITLAVDNWSAPGKYRVTLKLEPGKEYYFDVSPRAESYSATLLGGYVGLGIDAQINENSGLFKIVPITKDAAIAKLNSLSFTQ